MEENQKYLTEEMECIQIGIRLNHLIESLESMYSKEIDKRDDWWVMKFSNLLDTYETVTSKRYKYLRDEITHTIEKLNLNHPTNQRSYNV